MKNKEHQDFNSIWLSWEVKNLGNEGLLSSEFNLSTSNRRDIYVPLAWLQGLFNKYGALNILRTSEHLPEDPYELVEFIKRLELTAKTGQIQL